MNRINGFNVIQTLSAAGPRQGNPPVSSLSRKDSATSVNALVPDARPLEIKSNQTSQIAGSRASSAIAIKNALVQGARQVKSSQPAHTAGSRAPSATLVKKVLPQDAPFKSNQPSAAKQHIQQLEDELALALEKASALDAEKARLGKELGEAHIQISESALEIRDLKVQVDAGQQERAILEGKLDAAVKKVDSLEAEVDQLEEKLEDSESSRETDVMVFETECRSKDQVYSALYKTHLDLEAKLALVTADLHKKDQQCIMLGGKFQALCQELEPVRSEMEEMAATSLALGEENRRLWQRLFEQLQEGGATFSANQFDLEAFRMQVTSAVQRQERTAAQHELAKATEEALQAQVDRLSGELKRLEHTRQAEKRMSQMKCDTKDKIYSVLSENFKKLLMTQASTPNLDVEKSSKVKEQRISRPAKAKDALLARRLGAVSVELAQARSHPEEIMAANGKMLGSHRAKETQSRRLCSKEILSSKIQVTCELKQENGKKNSTSTNHNGGQMSNKQIDPELQVKDLVQEERDDSEMWALESRSCVAKDEPCSELLIGHQDLQAPNLKVQVEAGKIAAPKSDPKADSIVSSEDALASALEAAQAMCLLSGSSRED
jgi:hypothetical protein